MQIHLKTLGCRLNEAEIESWGKKFQEKGHKITGELIASKIQNIFRLDK